MNKKSINNISSDRAIEIINDELPLFDFYVDRAIKITQVEGWDKEIIIDNCIIEKLEAISVIFEKPVLLRNSHFKECSFTFSYFLKGLKIENCTFDSYLDFQAGGHNNPGFPIKISKNMFNDFVNFFDCWYEGEFELTENKFKKGTNVESKDLFVAFDIAPLIKENIGQTDLEGENPLINK